MRNVTPLEMIVAPSGRPLNVPEIEPALMMVNFAPAVGVYVRSTFKVALPKLAAPVTVAWSYWLHAVAPAICSWYVEPLARLRLLMVMQPGLLPMLTVAPLWIVAAPIVPVPFNVEPDPTVTGEPAKEPLNEIVPPLITNDVLSPVFA